MMSDFLFMDEIADLIKCQRVPRLLYKKGMCTEGYFIPYMNLSEYTTAKLFTETEEETPVVVRFSKVFSQYGASDTKRDAAGFFVRFFTKEGRFDLLSHSLPLPQEIRTPQHLIDFLSAFRKKEESTEMDDTALFVLAAEQEEFIPLLLSYFSDRATVKSYRGIEGFPLNDYFLVNQDGKRQEASFFWRPVQGPKFISRQEAEFFAGYDANVAVRDMIDAVYEGQFPEYNLELHLADNEKLTVGKLKITAVADSCASEDIGYTPLNLVPGIELAANEFNRFTAFAFNESARIRGGMR